MKTLTLTNCTIQEIVIVPNQPVVVRYSVNDSTGKAVSFQTAVLKTLPAPAQAVLDSLLIRMLSEITTKEGLT